VYIALILATALAACSPPAAPTVDASQVQRTAEAIAATSVALTVAAIPPTPVPTETPQPTPTSFPTPNLSLIPTLVSPTAASQAAQDNCLHPLALGAAGPGHKTLVKNQTGGTINLSLNLYEPNAFGECGAISYANLTKNSSVTVDLPAGYWYAYAWASVNGSDFKTSGSFFVQPAQFDKIELCVRETLIVYKPQC
jgi:hypothetical protein